MSSEETVHAESDKLLISSSPLEMALYNELIFKWKDQPVCLGFTIITPLHMNGRSRLGLAD